MQAITHKLSKSDIQRHIEAKLDRKVKIISVKTLKAVLQVTYKISGVKGNCSSFFSKSGIQADKIQKIVLDARAVEFVSVTHGSALTSNGHIANLTNCTCKSFLEGFSNLYVDGHKTCKHTIAYAKQVMGLSGFKAFAAVLSGVAKAA